MAWSKLNEYPLIEYNLMKASSYTSIRQKSKASKPNVAITGGKSYHKPSHRFNLYIILVKIYGIDWFLFGNNRAIANC